MSVNPDVFANVIAENVRLRILVEDIRQQHNQTTDASGASVCEGCWVPNMDPEWPCPTVRLIEESQESL